MKVKNPNEKPDKKTSNSRNYFRLYKEIENSPDNSFTNQKTKRGANITTNSLKEKIYLNYSKKLGDYYNKNKEDLYLYGSKKYDILPIDNLVKEMKQYKNTVIKSMRQNPNKYKSKNYSLKSHDDKLILTPLAEKERSKMGDNEMEQFNAAERFGVVMRRIEYTNLIDKNGKTFENNKIFFVMKDAISKIEKCWLFYKYSKKRKLIRGMILLEKYIKRKVLKLLNHLNNEKLKNIYMNKNFSSISFKNDLELKNNANSNDKLKANNIINNKDEESINKEDNMNNKNNEICFIGEIRINGDKKQNQDNLKKKYLKLMLNYKILKDKLNKYIINLENKINNLINDNNNLKNEKNELIKNYDKMSLNYKNLLNDYETLNSKLIDNQTSINNTLKNTIPKEDNEEYFSLLNEFNELNEKHNKLLKEFNNIKNKDQELNNININLENKINELNELLLKNEKEKKDIINIEEINKYKINNDNLNNELIKMKNIYEQQITNLNMKINQLINEQKLLKDNNNENINQNNLLQNKINEYESKEINVYQKKINELKNKNDNNEKVISSLKNQIENNKKEIIKITKEKQIINQNVNNLKSNLNNTNKIIEEDKLKIEEFEKKINIYTINNKKLKEENNKNKDIINKLKEENNKNKDIINKLNNLIEQLNLRIKQLLEENRNIINNKNILYLKNSNKIFLLFIDSILKKKIIQHKYQFMIDLLQENMDNFSKYIIYQNNSMKKSSSLEGYEKVLTGESKKVILQENNKNKEIKIDNKIIIHQDLDDTLKDYITKGKDNLLFEEIFEDVNSNNNNDIFINNYKNK